MRRCLIAFAAAALFCASAAYSQVFLPRNDLDRSRTWEVDLGAHWMRSETIDFRGGSTLKLDNDTGFGFGFAYNFNSQFSLGASFEGFEPDYHATIASADPSQEPDRFSGNVRLTTAMVDGTYYILPRSFTPYVSAGVGFTNVDTDIPRGPPLVGCWWDPWYGYVCDYFVRTKQEDEFSYRAEAGLRWDITPFFYVKGSYGRTWLDVGHSAGDAQLDVWRIDVGFRP
jgi:opacity protein-like surface antigen